MSEPAVASWRRVLCPGDPLMRLRLIVAALGLTTLIGAACSSADPSTVIAGDSTTAEHNEADVRFAQGMTHHHSQAVEMAELASARAESAEVKDLAERIAAAQAREVEQMAAWLEDWGEPGEADGMDGILPGESVMMTDADMSALEIGRASGRERVCQYG